jgi:glutaconate CoA-transferase, subunit A
MASSKVCTMREAISRFTSDGDSIAMGLALEALIPFAAGHEIIRQRRRGLTLIGPISDILFDQLIGAGCVKRVVAAWIGNVSAGLGYNYRRAAEDGLPHPIEIVDHSNFTIALGLTAGALGVPYLPARTLLGSDIARADDGPFKYGASPFGGERLLHVSAIVPDVTILHVQRASDDGGCHAWGNLGVSAEAALAGRRVIVIAEEIVDRSVITSDPNRVLVPPHRVSAVVHEPGGAHPSSVQGYYGRDHAFYGEYHSATKTAAGSDAWFERWVRGVDGRARFLELLGARRWNELAVRNTHLAAPVNYSAT